MRARAAAGRLLLGWLLVVSVLAPLARGDDAIPMTDDDVQRVLDELETSSGPRLDLDDIGALFNAPDHTAAAEDIRLRLGQALATRDFHRVADEISAMRPHWPDDDVTRWVRTLRRLRRVVAAADADRVDGVPEDERRAVEAVLGLTTPHGRLPFGREAVPVLFEIVGDASDRAGAALGALRKLVQPGDEIAIRRLVLRGRHEAAQLFAALRGEEAGEALLYAVEAGTLSQEIVDELRYYATAPRVRRTVVDWLRAPTTHATVGAAVDLVGADAAAPVLPEVLSAVRAEGEAPFVSVTTALLTSFPETCAPELLNVLDRPGSIELRRDAYRALAELAGRDPASGPDPLDEVALPIEAASLRRWWETEGSRVTPPHVARRVRELLSGFTGKSHYSPWNATVREIATLGPCAIGELLRIAEESDGQFGRDFGMRHAVADALERLIDDRDVPRVQALLVQGRTSLASALSGVSDGAAVEALTATVRAGFLDHEVGETLMAHAEDPAVIDALLDGLAVHRSSSTWRVGEAARLLADARSSAAVPLLLDTLPRLGSDPSHAEVADALARLGEADGLRALVDLVSSGQGTLSAWGAHQAAQSLNRIVGRRVWVGTFHPRTGTSGNLAAASLWFREWLAQEPPPRFDRDAWRWTVGPAPEAVGFDLSAFVSSGDPEMRSRVRELLAPAYDRNGVVGSPSEARRVAALGRDALPAVVGAIREHVAWDEHPGPHAMIAGHALAGLVDESDAPLLVALLREGYTVVAPACQRVADPRLAAPLADVVASGLADWGVLQALERHAAAPETRAAFSTWLDTFGRHDSGNVYWFVQFLNVHPEVLDHDSAWGLIDRDALSQAIAMPVLAAMVRTGDRRAVGVLLEQVSSAIDTDNQGYEAGDLDLTDACEALNSVAGRLVYRRAATPWSLAGAGLRTSHERFLDWWSRAPGVTFDAARRTWHNDGDPPPATDPLPPTDADAVARVAAIRYRGDGGYFSTGPRSLFEPVSPDDFPLFDESARELHALGRPAIAPLVSALRETSAWSTDRSGLYAAGGTLARDGLLGLLGEDDVDIAVGLLLEGRLQLARLIEGRHDPRWRAALLEVVRRGFMSGDLAAALLEHAEHRDVHDALIAWVTEHGGTSGGSISWPDPAELIGELLGTPDAESGKLVVADVLDRPLPPRIRWHIGVHAARRGVLDGLRALVECAEQPGAMTTRTYAELTRATAGLVEVDPFVDEREEKPKVRVSFGSRTAGVPTWLRNDDARAKATPGAARLREWWDANRDRLVHDAEAEVWRVAPR